FGGGGAVGQGLLGGGGQLGGGDEPVGAMGDGDRPFGVRPEGQAGDAQHGRLLLYASGVGHDQRRPAYQRQEVDVAERFDDLQVLPVHQPGVGQPLPAARVQRHDD